MDNYKDIEFDRPAGEAFSIQNDAQAGWAMRKIKTIRAHRDRFVGQCDERKSAYCREIDALIDQTRKGAERDESYLVDMLRQYADTQADDAFDTSKKTGVKNYRLPEGKLVYKPPKAETKHDDAVLLASLKAKGLTDYIKTIEAPKWTDIKKALIVEDGKEGSFMLATADGECIDIDGISETMVQGAFEVEVR